MGGEISQEPRRRTDGVLGDVTSDHHRGRTQTAYFFCIYANDETDTKLQAAQVPEVLAG